MVANGARIRGLAATGLAVVLGLSLGLGGCGSGNGTGTRNDRGGGDNDGGGGDDVPQLPDDMTSTDDGPRPFNDMGKLLDAYGMTTVNDAGVLVPLCGNHVCACADGQDNDGDGLADTADPECTGPLDDDEKTFATGIPGDNRDPHQDCFFDGDSGAGNDGCTDRISGNIRTNCVNCLPLLPTGCDCYGCCTVRIDTAGTTRTIQIGGSCTVAEIDNPEVCPPCEQVKGCTNDVDCTDPCDICLGTIDCRNLPEGNPDQIPCYTPPKSCGDVVPPPDGGPAPDAGTPDGGSPPPQCTAKVPCPANCYCLTGQCICPQG